MGISEYRNISGRRRPKKSHEGRTEDTSSQTRTALPDQAFDHSLRHQTGRIPRHTNEETNLRPWSVVNAPAIGKTSLLQRPQKNSRSRSVVKLPMSAFSLSSFWRRGRGEEALTMPCE